MGSIVYNIESLKTESVSAPWILGVGINNNKLEGLGYLAQCFGTGFATLDTAEDAFEVDTTSKYIWSIQPTWYDTLLNTPVTKPAQTLTTYGLTKLTPYDAG